MSKRSVGDWLREAFFAKDKASLDQIVRNYDAQKTKDEDDPEENGEGNGHKEPDGDEGRENEIHSGHKGGIHIHVTGSGDEVKKTKDEETEERLKGCEDGIKSISDKLTQIMDHMAKDNDDPPPWLKKEDEDEDEDGDDKETKDEGGSSEASEGQTGALTASPPPSVEYDLGEADPALKTGKSMMGDAAYNQRRNAAWTHLQQETRSRAEVLAPGITIPTFDAAPTKTSGQMVCDLRRAALKTALTDEAKRRTIGPHLTPAVLKQMSCDSVRYAFLDASDRIRAANNQAGRPSPAFMGDASPRAVWEEQRERVKTWQQGNNDFWTKNGGLGPQVRH